MRRLLLALTLLAAPAGAQVYNPPNSLVPGGAVFTLGSTSVTYGSTVTSVSGLTLVAPILGTPTSVNLSNGTALPISTGLSGAGTGVLTALGINVGSAGAFVTSGGALGTPSAGTLTNATGLPIGGITGLGTGVGTWLATPSSANLAAALTDETGSGAAVFATSPTLVTPTLGAAAATSFAVGGALPSAAANTLIIGGVSSNPTFGADGEGGAWLSTSNGAIIGGRGSSNDLLFVNKSISIVLRNPTGTTNLVGNGTLTGLTGLTSSGTITLSGVTTGTNTNFACYASGGVATLQSSACTISSLRFKNLIGPQPVDNALADVLKLDPIAFTMKTGEVPNPDWNYDKPQIGISAENVAAVNPKCAIYEQDGKTPKSYRQECVIAELVGAVRALKAELDEVRRRR